MIDHAGIILASGTPRAGMFQQRRNTVCQRKVVGKAQLAVSALGMIAIATALFAAQMLIAAGVALLALGALLTMFERALAVFHASSASRAGPPSMATDQAAAGD
jgi:hypothetical protein